MEAPEKSLNVDKIKFDWGTDPRKLSEIFKETHFQEQFNRFIAEDAIRIFSPQLFEEPYNLVYDEDLVYSRLIKPLEEFIIDMGPQSGTEEIRASYDHLKTLQQPSKMCRRVLKTGDVLFSCSDCGMDDTCVVCIDCFQKSAHKDHNYKMANTEGGGCCDCGDIEAWKQNYACSEHQSTGQSNVKLSDFEDVESRSRQIHDDKVAAIAKIQQLPRNVAGRYFCVCQASLQYAFAILTCNKTESLPVGLENLDSPGDIKNLTDSDVESKNYFTVLYNDEVHTYDHVINSLVKIIKCTKMVASIVASTVSREGRCAVAMGDQKSCEVIEQKIKNVRDPGQGPLKVEVSHGLILAYQAFALKLIKWIQNMSLICDGFRILTAYTLLGSFDDDDTFIDRIMLSNTALWKMARIEWNDLLVTTMLSDYHIKEKFARLVTRKFPLLVNNFIKDDHDHSVSILTMTTQLYTVPSLICMLIEEENALTVISGTLIAICRNSKREVNTFTYENRASFDMIEIKRGFYVIADMKHLINVRPTKWTDKLRQNVIEAVKIFLDLLASMQGMDSVKRQLGHHLEYEPDWESGMTLQNRLIGLITSLVKYCSYDEEVLIETLRDAQRRLKTLGGHRKAARELFGYSAKCVQYDVAQSPVSIHLPLTRFVAALVLELMQRRPSNEIPYDESLVILGDQRMVDVMEPSLRTEVMIAQFRSGMWRRNGYSLVNQIMYFHSTFMRREMFDRDILLLQEAAAMCEPNAYMIHLLNKFSLCTWVTSETTREPLVGQRAVSSQNDEEVMAQTMSLGEEFLQLLLTIIAERYRVGIGKIEEQDVIKNELIQLLCVGPTTRSDLTQKLYVNDSELDCIKTIAKLKRSTESGAGKYELKDEFYDRFNPFFYHYNRRLQSNALDFQLKRKKNMKETFVCCPPPKPVEITQQFSNLNQLLKCDIMLIVIQKILRRASGLAEGSQESPTIKFSASDLQLDQCLHLIGLGIYEQEREPVRFDFVRAAYDKDIFNLLKQCHDKNRSKDLIAWSVNRLLALIDLIGREHQPDAESASIHANIRELFSNSGLAMKSNLNKDPQLAEQRRQRIQAMMKAQQNKFLNNPATKELVSETEVKMECEEAHDSAQATHLCILCRDEQKVDFDKPTMVLLAYIQRSAVLSKNRHGRRIPHYSLTPSNQLRYQQEAANYSFTSDNSWSFDATFMPSDLFFGPNISTCGHVMHYECWEGFFDAVTKRETSRTARNSRHVSFELEKNEILCPLCECISNATIPMLPDYMNFSGQSGASVFAASPSTISRSAENLSACLAALRGTVDMFKRIRQIKEFVPDNHDDKYMRLLQPKPINDVLEELDEPVALSLRDFINTIRNENVSSKVHSKNLLKSISTLAERIYRVGLDLDSSVTDVNHTRIFMMTSWSISYSVQALERVARFKGTPLFEDLESAKNLCLDSLIRFACSSMLIHQSDMMQCLLVRKLRYLLINDEHLSSSPCCLEIDAFETFVSLFILLQKLYAHLDNTGGVEISYPWTTKAFNHEYFRNILHLILLMNLLQVIISLQNELGTEQRQDGPLAADSSKECQSVFSFYKDTIITSGHPNSRMADVDERFLVELRHRLLPFLRSCAMFFYHLTHIKPPQQLCESSAFFEGKRFSSSSSSSSKMGDESVDSAQKSEPALDLEATEKEFGSICAYLDLPNDFAVLLHSPEARDLARSWLRHSRVLPLIRSALSGDPSAGGLMPVKLVRQPHSVNRLIELPHDYSELVDEVSDFTCPSIKNEDSRTPTMCLVCGVMLCSQSYCCQRDLNDLASNYKQVLQRQSEARQASSEANSSPAAGAGAHQFIQRLVARPADTSSALTFMGSAAALLVSTATGTAASSSNSQIHQQLVGSCTYHAHECSGGVGVFLRIRNCQILLLSGRSKGCYMPAPYTDNHGETDYGLVRGNPMQLNRLHYERLQHMWMSHSIPEQISRTLEYSAYASSVNWYLH